MKMMPLGRQGDRSAPITSTSPSTSVLKRRQPSVFERVPIPPTHLDTPFRRATYWNRCGIRCGNLLGPLWGGYHHLSREQ
jgi:hypothetical protein